MQNQFKILAFTLISVIIFFSCVQEKKQELNADVSAQMVKFPANPNLVAFANLEAVYSSAFYKTFEDFTRDLINENKIYDELFNTTGIDMKKDVKYFLMAVYTSEQEPKNVKPLAILSGKFDHDKILEFVKQKDTEQQFGSDQVNGNTLYFNKNAAFAVLEDQIIVLGRLEKVKEWLSMDEQSSPDNEIMGMIEPVHYKQGMWMIMKTDAMIKNMLSESDLKQLGGFTSIQNMYGSALVDENLQFHGYALVQNDTDAQLLFDAIKGAVSAAKLSVSNDRDAVDVLNKLNLDLDKNKISLDFKMDHKEFEKVLNNKKEFLKSAKKEVI